MSSSGPAHSNSLDWDSPSTKTGTVKRRPLSSDSESSASIQAGGGFTQNHADSISRELIENFSSKRANNKSCIPAYLGAKVSKFSETSAKTKQKTAVAWRPTTVKQNSSGQLPTRANGSSERKTVAAVKQNDNAIRVAEKNQPGEETTQNGAGNASKPREFGIDKVKWIALGEANAYLIERKSCGYSSTSRTGKVSDSDSGIASPLSPSSLYGFLGCGDKDSYRRHVDVRKEIGILQNCSCVKQQVQVKY